MNTFQQFNKFTKVALVSGIALLVYGYTCRIIPIYFFWESKFIGWMILLIGIISILSYRIKVKRKAAKKVLWEKIGIGLLVFFLLIQSILLIVLPNTDAYKASKVFFKQNEQINQELGPITGFCIIPYGAIQVSSGPEGSTGNARLVIIVKGQKKYEEYTVDLLKEIDTEWKVTDFE